MTETQKWNTEMEHSTKALPLANKHEQELNCVAVNGERGSHATSSVPSDHTLSTSAFCFACGDSTQENKGGDVLCQFCLMILDNSSNWGIFLTDKDKHRQATIMEANQPTLAEGGTSVAVSDSTTDARPMNQHISRSALCQVCGASASGLHFGVFTCEGCKCFYRRTIKEGVTYVCTKSNDCSVTMESRNSCRYCRFQKCMSLGMCKEGIKLGRRPKVDGDLRFSNNLRKNGDDFSHPMNVSRWNSWPTVSYPSDRRPIIKQEPIYPGDMHDCSGYGSPYPTKHQPYSYCKQKSTLNSLQNDTMVDPSFNNEFECDVYSGGQTMPQSSYPTGYQNSSHASYATNVYHHNPTDQPINPSLSMTLPEVRTGAFTAMAYANMYRGQYTNESCNVEIKVETSDDVELTELKPLRKNNQFTRSETNIVSSSSPMSYDAWEQYKQKQTNSTNETSPLNNTNDVSLKRRISNLNDKNNNSKLQKTNGSVSENFVAIYEQLEKLVIEEWTSSLQSSGNISEVLNPQKSSMPKVKACFRRFAESIAGFNDLTKESKDRFVRQALCPVLGIIITHHFMNKAGDKDPVLTQNLGCGEDIQRLSNLEMAVLCGICLPQKDKTQKHKDCNELYMMTKRMDHFLQTALQGLFHMDRYVMLQNLASRVCQTSND